MWLIWLFSMYEPSTHLSIFTFGECLSKNIPLILFKTCFRNIFEVLLESTVNLMIRLAVDEKSEIPLLWIIQPFMTCHYSFCLFVGGTLRTCKGALISFAPWMWGKLAILPLVSLQPIFTFQFHLLLRSCLPCMTG